MTDARRLLTGAQCRAARELLRLSPEALARNAGIYPETVRKFEAGRQATFPTLTKIREALQTAGVELTNGDEPGVKLRKAKT